MYKNWLSTKLWLKAKGPECWNPEAWDHIFLFLFPLLLSSHRLMVLNWLYPWNIIIHRVLWQTYRPEPSTSPIPPEQALPGFLFWIQLIVAARLRSVFLSWCADNRAKQLAALLVRDDVLDLILTSPLKLVGRRSRAETCESFNPDQATVFWTSRLALARRPERSELESIRDILKTIWTAGRKQV